MIIKSMTFDYHDKPKYNFGLSWKTESVSDVFRGVFQEKQVQKFFANKSVSVIKFVTLQFLGLTEKHTLEKRTHHIETGCVHTQIL